MAAPTGGSACAEPHLRAPRPSTAAAAAEGRRPRATAE